MFKCHIVGHGVHGIHIAHKNVQFEQIVSCMMVDGDLGVIWRVDFDMRERR